MFSWLKTFLGKSLFHKIIFAFFTFLIISYTGFVFFGQNIKHHAIDVFNAKMAEQKAMKGKLAMEDISAHLDGTVEFTNLAWLNEQNQPLLKVNKGRLKVNPLDVLFSKIGARSLYTIELEEGDFVISLDEKMRGDIIAKDRIKQHENGISVKPSEGKNLQLPDKLGRKSLILRNCSFTVVHKHHLHTLTQVNGKFLLKDGKLAMELKTGKFGGHMHGDSFEIKGEANTNPGQEKLDATFKLTNIIPSSLGLGNIKDNVTLEGHATGTLVKPKLDGQIYFTTLDLPKLHFDNVKGNYHYEDNVIHVMDVKGYAFSGNVDAFGEYDFKTRAHKIFVQGYNLNAEEYFSAENLHCRLNLEMEMINDGTKYGTVYRGFFKSGPGKYDKYSFHTISAFFRIIGKNLHFTKVVLDTNIGEFHSSELNVVNGKVKIKGLSWQPHHRIKRSQKNKH